MYFDLEFTRACNVGLDGEALVRAWINVVAGERCIDKRPMGLLRMTSANV